MISGSHDRGGIIDMFACVAILVNTGYAAIHNTCLTIVSDNRESISVDYDNL